MTAKVLHSELWGKRESKYSRLLEADVASTPWASPAPGHPFYLFVPRHYGLSDQYGQAWKINEAMPLNGVGMTTARDHVVIDFEEKPILERVRLFRDSTASDEELCRQLNIPMKKGWNIAKARTLIRQEKDLAKHITPVLYRPFDQRVIFYHDSLVWRTVKKVMRHMLPGENLALISARSNKSAKMDHFFVTRHIMETKCGESTTQSCLIPLYLGAASGDASPALGPPVRSRLARGGRPNLNPEFVAEMERRLGLKFIPDGRGDLGNAGVPPAVSGASRPREPERGQGGQTTGCGQSSSGVPQCNAALRAAVSGASRPRFGEVSIRDRGRLPHWEAEGAVYFVTFRLGDSLPRSVLEGFEAERADILRTAEQMGREPSAAERKRLAELFSERIESYLDKGCGACHLADRRVAGLVAEALRHFDGERYRLFAWCVMPNHVHVVFRPLPNHPLSEIVQSWKSYTAKHANRILCREGTFWQREYYGHLIRDEGQFQRTLQYVIDNPLRAGLRDWRWVWVCGQDARTTAGETPAVQAAGGEKPGTQAAAGETPAIQAGASRAAPGTTVGGTFGPEDVFHYIYAVFHSPTYRKRYAEFLKRDFPRVPMTSDLALFRQLCRKGADLVALHLVEGDYAAASWNRAQPPQPPPFQNLITTFPVRGDEIVEKVFYAAPGEPEPGTGKPLPPGKGRVYISKDTPPKGEKEGRKGQYFEGMPPEVWEFHVGGYQVCHKWLNDRKGRKLSYDDIQHYHKIVIALNETIRLMAEIDAAIPRWPVQ